MQSHGICLKDKNGVEKFERRYRKKVEKYRGGKYQRLEKRSKAKNCMW